MSIGGNKVEVDLEQLTAFTPFILVMDRAGTVTWASPAILKRAPGAVGVKASQIMSCVSPPQEVSPQAVEKSIGGVHVFRFFEGDAAVQLDGRWLSLSGGYLLLATPHAASGEDLTHFSFDDFPDGDHPVSYTHLTLPTN